MSASKGSSPEEPLLVFRQQNNLDSRLLTFAIWRTIMFFNMVRSIPPGRKPDSRPYPINAYRVKKYTPRYTGRRNGTLEALLAKAERLESEQIEVVKLLPDDEELQRLDKLQWVIRQLKTQIALRVKRLMPEVINTA